MSAPTANARTEIVHPGAFSARMIFFTSAALTLISGLQFALTDRYRDSPLLSVLDIGVIAAGLAGTFFGSRHMGRFTIPMESPAEFRDIGLVRRALEQQSIRGKDNVIVRRGFALFRFLMMLVSDAQLLAMSPRIQTIAWRAASVGSKLVLLTAAILVVLLLSPGATAGLPYLLAAAAWASFYVWLMLYLRSRTGKATTRVMTTSMVEGAGHPQMLYQILENRARTQQSALGPIRLFAKAPLLQQMGVQDTGSFEAVLLYEDPPVIGSSVSAAQFGTVVTPVAGIGLISGVWILHTMLQAQTVASTAFTSYFLVFSGLWLCLRAWKLAWDLDSTFRFCSNLILVVIDGTYHQSRVRVGRSLVDSNESDNLATRSDIRVLYYSAEALSETDDIVKSRDLTGLAVTPQSTALIELFRSDVEAFSNKGVTSIGIQFNGAIEDISRLNMGMSQARADYERAAVAASRGVPRVEAAPIDVPIAQLPAPTVTDSKVCPDCAETVKIAARKCKHCGYIFSESDTNTSSTV